MTITISEAIKELESEDNQALYIHDKKRLTALKLGIEALKEVQQFRKNPDHYKLELLLGEELG